MERINDSYKLSTGKFIHPNNGIIGLTECDDLKIYEGYDGTWTTKDEAFNEDDIDLTDVERTEIALYMSDLWRKLADTLSNKITAEWLQSIHPELFLWQAGKLKEFCIENTITYKECYGDGSIMFPKFTEKFNYRYRD